MGNGSCCLDNVEVTDRQFRRLTALLVTGKVICATSHCGLPSHSRLTANLCGSDSISVSSKCSIRLPVYTGGMHNVLNLSIYVSVTKLVNVIFENK